MQSVRPKGHAAARVAVKPDGRSQLDCPVCGAVSERRGAIPDWGDWMFCSACQLEFANPLELPETPQEMFSAAYAGDRTKSSMREFKKRTDERAAIVRDPELWFWTPAFGEILDWVGRTVPEGGTVFEVGCGLGFVLHSLKRRGYEAVGLDVAETPVMLNRADGFKVWHGTIDTVPDGWVKPDAIISFFLMHHLPEPMDFLATIRQKWPDVPMAIAQYGPSCVGWESSVPPRTLIRWSAPALKSAMERNGFEAESHSLPSTGTESRAVKWLGRIARPPVRLGSLRRGARRIQRRLLPHFLGHYQRDDFVLVAFGKPGAVVAPATPAENRAN
jgi:SAM-dependent methyltransferase